jgi:hypothetical protein
MRKEETAHMYKALVKKPYGNTLVDRQKTTLEPERRLDTKRGRAQFRCSCAHEQRVDAASF